jgi:hypothetical protein
VSNIAPAHQWLCPTGNPAAVTAFTAAVGLAPDIEWQMQPGEQTALVALLAGLRPKVAIEIGSRYGGSMQVLAKYAERVISVDIDPTCKERLGPRFPNAEFVTGDSRETFPPLMTRLEQEGAEVGFVLIDGDHTAAGVQADVRGLLTYRPKCPLFVVMHDSFNPPVRQGIRSAPWASNPHVHAVELDFVHGVLTHDPEAYREMWGGLALAVLLPTPRPGPLTVTGRMDHQFRHLYKKSAHYKFDLQTLPGRVVNKCRNMVGLKTGR